MSGFVDILNLDGIPVDQWLFESGDSHGSREVVVLFPDIACFPALAKADLEIIIAMPRAIEGGVKI